MSFDLINSLSKCKTILFLACRFNTKEQARQFLTGSNIQFNIANTNSIYI